MVGDRASSMDYNTTAPPEASSTRKSTKKRVRNFSPEDRAAHRIFERGRREAFKERLTELAGQLPGLAEADPRHLSKHVVVDESIARHKLLESRCVEALHDIRSLVRERDELLAEVNLWRHGAGTAPRRPQTVCRVEGLVETEKESQRRPSAGHAWRCSEKNGGSSGGRSQDRTGPDEVTIEASHIPRILPAEPALEPHALSHLDDLLLNTPWSGPPPAQPPSTTAFPSEPPPMTMPNHHVSLGSNAAIPDVPLSATTTSSADDYQIFGDVGLHQQLPLLNMDSFPPPPPSLDAGLFTESVPLSPGYMASTGLDHGVSLQQPQQWVSWHG